MDHKDLMQDELKKLNITIPIERIIGSTFIFGNKDSHIIMGSIISIGYGPKEGLSLRVSSPKFKGQEIKKVTLKPDGVAMIEVDGMVLHPGKLNFI